MSSLSVFVSVSLLVSVCVACLFLSPWLCLSPFDRSTYLSECLYVLPLSLSPSVTLWLFLCVSMSPLMSISSSLSILFGMFLLLLLTLSNSVFASVSICFCVCLCACLLTCLSVLCRKYELWPIQQYVWASVFQLSLTPIKNHVVLLAELSPLKVLFPLSRMQNLLFLQPLQPQEIGHYDCTMPNDGTFRIALSQPNDIPTIGS